MSLNIEDFKKLFDTESLHIAIATIQQLEMVSDRSVLRVIVNMIPENIPLVARMTWEHVGPNSGIYAFPQVGDLVLIGFAEDDEDQCFVLRRLSSKEDKIPLRAVDGHTVVKSLTEKKLWLTSGTNIYLTKGDTVPTENLVLGQVFKSLMQSFLSETASHADSSAKHKHIGNMGYYTAPPDLASNFNSNKSNYNALKASPVDNENVLSDLSFTEKG